MVRFIWANKSNALQPHVRGFTLIEVLVALAIFGGGILGITAAISLSLRAATESARLESAARLAENQIELAIAQPAELLVPAEGNTDGIHWVISYEAREHNLMKVTVETTWLDRQTPRMFRLERVFLPVTRE